MILSGFEVKLVIVDYNKERKMRKLKLLISLIGVLAFLAVSLSGSALAASTTKSLSTVYTLVNLGDTVASVSAQYIKGGLSGGAWAADPANTNFTIDPDGGQAIVRQYFDTTLTPGQGSVVISSSQPLGSFVQILARNQVPTSGAYNGVTTGSNISYLPTLQRMNNTSSGLVNSQIIIQNADSISLDFTVTLRRITGEIFTKPLTGLQPGASYYYDLADETGLPTGWVGSGTVQASGTGKLAVVSNMFVGTDGLMSYNAFPAESATSEWYIPLFTSRLSNGQSGTINVQNVSGGTIAANDIQLTCAKDPLSTSTQATVTVENTSSVDDQNLYSFNPVMDTTNFPADWYGSCRVFSKTSKNLVVFGMIRYTNGIQMAAAYEGIPSNSTAKTLYVPLVMKKLSNGQCTVATIQNLNSSIAATVTMVYTPSAEYVKAGGSASVITINNVSIPAGGSINRNLRLPSGEVSEPLLPFGWYGTLKVISDQPVQAMIQISNLYSGGDNLMANLGFVK